MGNSALNIGAEKPQLLARWYALALIVGCFGWPLVLGIAAGLPRLLWLPSAFLLILISIVAALHAARDATMPAITTARPPWPLFVLFSLIVAIATIFPVTFFSDEEAIAIPTLNLLSRIAQWITWPGVAIACISCIGATALLRRRVQNIHVWIVFAMLFASSVGWGLLNEKSETLLVRFPPFVHASQLLATAIGGGLPATLRLANVGWTALLCITAWYLIPTWKPSARIALVVGACLTPLGWTYRLLLYQACGEITLALATVLILCQVLRRSDGQKLALHLGMLFGLWILYRPTAQLLACASIAILFAYGRRRAARDIALISLPVGALWTSIYVFGSFQYSFLSGTSDRHFALWKPIADTMTDLPNQLHPLGLLILIVGSAVVFWKRPADRMLLRLGWLFGLVNTLAHQLLTIERWYGYGRFNILLILPLAICVGSLTAWAGEKRRIALLTPLFVALLWITPFRFIDFLQSQRATHLLDRIERTVTGGVDPTPLPAVIIQLADDRDTMTVLSPSYAFLDLLIAHGTLTVAEREGIVARAKAWTPSSAQRPVIVLSPQPGMTYRTNITDSEEKRLLKAAEWANAQPNKREVFFGKERVVVVP